MASKASARKRRTVHGAEIGTTKNRDSCNHAGWDRDHDHDPASAVTGKRPRRRSLPVLPSFPPPPPLTVTDSSSSSTTTSTTTAVIPKKRKKAVAADDPDHPLNFFKDKKWEIQRLSAQATKMTGSAIFCQICLQAEDPFGEEGRGHDGVDHADGEDEAATDGDLVFCKGNCFGAFHRSCMEDEAKKQLTATEEDDLDAIEEEEGEELITSSSSSTPLLSNAAPLPPSTIINGEDLSTDFKCLPCQTNRHPCFMCNQLLVNDGEATKRCSVNSCGRFYHPSCLRNSKKFGCADLDGKKTECPQHACLACWIENRNGFRAKHGKFLRCVKCPSAYHVGDFCVPAGHIPLGGNNILCPDHFVPKRGVKISPNLNVAYCFACSLGGSLLCCETCTAAYHIECLGMQEIPMEKWFCGKGSVGKRPKFGDVVWAKLGLYRWWPAEICHPRHIPDNVLDVKKFVGQFCVQFFGTHDWAWLHMGRTFAYQEGDSSRKVAAQKKMDELFKTALEEAAEAYAAFEQFRADLDPKETVHDQKKPSKYRFIKTSVPYGNITISRVDPAKLPVCECKADQTDPPPCSSNDECLNRMLMYECHPSTCKAKEKLTMRNAREESRCTRREMNVTFM